MAAIAIKIGISLAVGLASSLISSLFAPTQKTEGQRLDDLNAPRSTFGQQITKAWGTVRVGGNVIWAEDIKEVVTTTRSGGKGGPRVENTEYSYFGTWATLLSQGEAIAIRKLWLNSRLVVDLSPEASDDAVSASNKFLNDYLRFHSGSFTQMPDPTIEASKGVGRTPAYRGRCYLVFDELPLAEYGNAFPAVSAELVFKGQQVDGRWVGEPESLETIVTDITREMGYEDNEIDASELTIPVDGYAIQSASAALEQLEALQTAYFFDVAESQNGTIKFVTRKRNTQPTALEVRSMGAYVYGQQEPQRYLQSRERDSALPRQVVVTFPDPNVEYRQGQQNSVVRAGTESVNQESLSLGVSLSASQARTIADKTLFLRWIERREYRWPAGIQFFAFEVADLVSLPFFGEQTAQLYKIRMGANLLLNFEAKGYEGHIHDHSVTVKQPYSYTFTAIPGESVVLPNAPITEWVSLTSDNVSPNSPEDYTIDIATSTVTIVVGGALDDDEDENFPFQVTANYFAEESRDGVDFAQPGAANLNILDVNALTDRSDEFGVYVAAAGNNRWSRGSLFAKEPLASEYVFLQTIQRSQTGVAQSALGEASPSVIDRANVLTVEVTGSLQSVTEGQMLAGANTAVLGNEIIRFQTAQKIGATLWELSTFIRGARGTESFISGHSVGDRFVMMDTVEAVEADVRDVGANISFKALASGQSLDEVDTVTELIIPARIKPYAPVLVSLVDNGANWVIRWDRRDRRGADLPLFSRKPMSEVNERYRIRVNGEVIAVTTGLQANLGNLSSGDNIQVAQISQLVGDGYYLEVTI